MRVPSAVVGLFLSFLPASALANDELRIVDLTGQFDRFAMASRTLTDEQRIAAFETQIGPIADGFYSRKRSPDGYDFRVLVNLKTYPERRAGVLAVRQNFRESFASAERLFEREFGRVTSTRPVYLIDSMGELDGGTRELGGKPTLLFGADVIAEVHSGKSLTAFFHHELFHLYYEAKAPSCSAIWCSLWEEGLATYVAHRLDPDATDDELILNLPEPIRPAVEANRDRSICEVVQRLDSASDEDFSALFQGDDKLPGYPSRMGYYVGFLVASDIGRTHGLHQMANMTRAEARPLIDASLARMATCPATTAEVHERSRTGRTGR